MRIIIYGKDWEDTAPVEQALDSFEDVIVYSLIAESDGSIRDFIDLVGTGENGIQGVIFVKSCPPKEMTVAYEYGLSSLVLFTGFSGIANEKIIIGNANKATDIKGIIKDIENFFNIIEKKYRKIA